LNSKLKILSTLEAGGQINFRIRGEFENGKCSAVLKLWFFIRH